MVKLSYTPRKSPQSFNLFNLLKSAEAPLGIELYQDTKFIQFHVSEERTRLISFSTHEEAREVYNAFIHLIAMAENKSTEAIFFLSRYAELKTSNPLLASSLRAEDKSELSGKEIIIESKGEGWLDKDSLPVGKWKFYARDEKQKEYLFKEGIYLKTNPGMFEVQGIDSAELNDNYHLSMQSLQEYRSKEIPFVKSGSWTYYQPDGKPAKTMDFISQRIPVSVSIMMEDPSSNKSTKLAIAINEKADEWSN
jgi:hypothetical protein